MDSTVCVSENLNIKIASLNSEKLLSATHLGDNTFEIRPVSYLSFALNYYFSGMDARAFRLTNVVLLALCGVCVFILGYLILGRWTESHLALMAAALAALIWTLHPLQSNLALYIVQRMTTLAILGYLVGFIYFIVGEKGSHLYWALAVLAALAGILSKEIALYLPFAVALYRIAWSAESRAWWAARRKLALAVLLVGAALVVLVIISTAYLYERRTFTMGQRLLTEARVLWYYLGIFLVPLPKSLNLCHAFPVSTSLFVPFTTFLSIVGHGAVLAATAVLWKKWRVVTLLTLLYYSHHFLESSFIGLELVFEHRMALPGVWLCLLIGYLTTTLVARITKNTKQATIATVTLGVAVAVVLIPLNRERAKAWQSQTSMWEDIVEKAPDDPRNHNNLASQYFQAGRFNEARQEAEKAIELAPAMWPSRALLGRISRAEGDCKRALEIFDDIWSRGIEFGAMDYEAGLCFRNEGKLNLALKAFDNALAFEPSIEGLRLKIAETYRELGDLELAKIWARKQLEFFPKDEEASRLLGTLEKLAPLER